MSEDANPYALLELAPFLLTVLTLLIAAAFVLWLGVFILNQLFNTSHEVPRERRWTVARQLTFGFTLLCLVVLLTIIQATAFYRPYTPTQVLPHHEIAP